MTCLPPGLAGSNMFLTKQLDLSYDQNTVATDTNGEEEG